MLSLRFKVVLKWQRSRPCQSSLEKKVKLSLKHKVIRENENSAGGYCERFTSKSKDSLSEDSFVKTFTWKEQNQATKWNGKLVWSDFKLNDQVYRSFAGSVTVLIESHSMSFSSIQLDPKSCKALRRTSERRTSFIAKWLGAIKRRFQCQQVRVGQR